MPFLYIWHAIDLHPNENSIKLLNGGSELRTRELATSDVRQNDTIF